MSENEASSPTPQNGDEGKFHEPRKSWRHFLTNRKRSRSNLRHRVVSRNNQFFLKTKLKNRNPKLKLKKLTPKGMLN